MLNPPARPVAGSMVEWPILRFMDALVDAVWEQSQSSPSVEYSLIRLGSLARYCCSIYGATCLLMALILNRTMVIASTNNTRNQQAQLNRNRIGTVNATPFKSSEIVKQIVLSLLRISSILLLFYHGYCVLVALKLHNQISTSRPSSISWLLNLIPDSLFAYDSYYFSNTAMNTPLTQVMIGPSTNMYWPIFLNFCFSSFAETFHSVAAGRKPYTESGITIFEHSISFQEFSSNGAFFFGDSRFHNRPTEQVLVSAFFLILTHLNVHIGGLINNNEYRLIPSSIFGIGFLTYFVASIYRGEIFEFPSILILTYIPQVLIVGIIFLSLSIFILAVVANGYKTQDLNYASFLSQENLENEIDYITQNANIRLSDDFYTAIMNLVMLSITSAGKSSYIAELSVVSMDDETWIERSLWDTLKCHINISDSRSGQNDNIIDFMRKNNITGYDNLIAAPSQHLISGSIGENKVLENSSVFFRRRKYVQALVVNFAQLVSALTKSGGRKFYRGIIGQKSIVRSSNESAQEFQKRKASVPGFLGKYLRPRTEVKSLSGQQSVETELTYVDLFSITEVEQRYHEIILGKDISEVDASADYELVEEESECESEDEEEEPAINDLITGSSFSEMITSSTNTILHHRMSSETMVTRSRFKKYMNYESEKEMQTNSLIQMILKKRSEGANQTSTELDSRLICVICQYNTREIITWPCKCFAICEPCRLSLVAKGMEGCVCCRRNVEGVSKVFIP